jgi:hypothetical protein
MPPGAFENRTFSRSVPIAPAECRKALSCMKSGGLFRKLRHPDGELVNWSFTFTAAVYNLVRLHTLSARGYSVQT